MFSCVRNNERSSSSNNKNSGDGEALSGNQQPKQKRRYKFRVHLLLKELEGVTLSNGVLFAKVRLLNGGSFCQYSKRKEIRDNRVVWSTDGQQGEQMQFLCKMSAPAHTGVLNPCELRISVRKEEKGGRSYSKVGYAKVDLATFGYCFTTTEHKCILSPYSQRVDNSTLTLSIRMENVVGDPIYRLPPAASVAGVASRDSVSSDANSQQSHEVADTISSSAAVGANDLGVGAQTPGLGARTHCRNPSSYSAASFRTHSRTNSIDQDNLGPNNPAQSSNVPSFDSANLPSSLERKRNGAATSRGELNNRIINTRSDNYQIVKELFEKEGIGVRDPKSDS